MTLYCLAIKKLLHIYFYLLNLCICFLDRSWAYLFRVFKWLQIVKACWISVNRVRFNIRAIMHRWQINNTLKVINQFDRAACLFTIKIFGGLFMEKVTMRLKKVWKFTCNFWRVLSLNKFLCKFRTWSYCTQQSISPIFT